ncbi:uncharacterized protein LOC117115466 [Anneissia japonica]|uniref:uncharacterized protein LOC117115466 n=1 Tax=Anneissia japonica TaxID=1529436 RepID=UPI0014257760|nr:uncharacterized protein LOC117115466 [Anneissia japonica]
MNTEKLELLPELHAAIRKGMYNDVRTIIFSGYRVINIRDPERRTPLSVCCFIEQEDWAVGIARMLLENDAKVGLTDRQGRNALIHACIYQRSQLVSLFLKAIDFDLDHRDRFGNTALFYASSTGNTEIVSALVDKMLKFKLGVDQVNRWRMSALMEACRLGHIHCANLLMSEGKASTDLRDKILGKSAQEWLQDHEGRQQISETCPRKLLRRKQQAVSVSQEFYKNIGIRSQTQFEFRSSGNFYGIPKQEQERPRSMCVSRVNRVRVKCVRRNWIQEAIGNDIINKNFQTCLYNKNTLQNEARMTSFSTSSNTFPGIHHWRGDFRQLYQKFEVFVSSSFRKNAIPNLQPPPQRSLTREDTNQSIGINDEGAAKGSHKNSSRIPSRPTTGSERTHSSGKYVSKKAEMSMGKGQMKHKRDDAASNAARILSSSFRRRNPSQK